MRPIIVPVDFSDNSINALEHALSIARKGGFDLRMIWVNRPDYQTPVFQDGDADPAGKVEDEFQRLIEKYQPTLPDSTIEYKIRKGKIHKEVVAAAIENNSFLIVTGTHGTSGFEELWMGSNANKIVSEAPCPVITIRGGVNINTNLDRIVMPIDSTQETRQKVPLTGLFATMFHSEVHVLVLYSTKVKAVRNSVDSYAEQSILYLMEHKIPYVLETIEVNKAVEDILGYASDVNANLISIMTEMEKSARNLWLGSYAQQLTNNSPIPVLICHPKSYLTGMPGF